MSPRRFMVGDFVGVHVADGVVWDDQTVSIRGRHDDEWNAEFDRINRLAVSKFAHMRIVFPDWGVWGIGEGVNPKTVDELRQLHLNAAQDRAEGIEHLMSKSTPNTIPWEFLGPIWKHLDELG